MKRVSELFTPVMIVVGAVFVVGLWMILLWKDRKNAI